SPPSCLDDQPFAIISDQAVRTSILHRPHVIAMPGWTLRFSVTSRGISNCSIHAFSQTLGKNVGTFRIMICAAGLPIKFSVLQGTVKPANRHPAGNRQDESRRQNTQRGTSLLPTRRAFG